MTIRIFRGGQPADGIEGDDRGLAYGDGVFETLRVHRGEAVWWREHWARLERGAQALGLPLPEEAAVRDECAALAADAGQAVLKIILTRGGGSRGYAPPVQTSPTLILSIHPEPPAVPAEGVNLRWCRTTLAIQPALAGIKHCNRLEQVLARAEWNDPDIFDGLMCDTDGRVVGATAANLFVRIDGRWLTPDLRRCGVAGVARSWLLRHLDAVAEAELSTADVENADAVFLSNAVRGILPVRRLGQRQWSPDQGIEEVRRRLGRLQPAFATEES